MLLTLALVVGVRSRAAAVGLAELVSEFVDQFDPQVAPHPIAAQHALEVLEDLLAGTAPGPRPREAGVEGLKRLGGRQQALAPALPPAQLQRRALDPHHGPPFMRGQERALYPPAIARGALTTTIGPIPEQLPGRLVRLQPLAKLTVFRARARQHAHEAPLSDTRKHVFGGFTKCCYPLQKFDTDPERRLAVIIDGDASAEKWIKPARNQFRIDYRSGEAYEPDFVVETKTRMLICEVKAQNELDDATVKAKAAAATKWCNTATEHAPGGGTKPWGYLLIPDDQIRGHATVDGLVAKFATS